METEGKARSEDCSKVSVQGCFEDSCFLQRNSLGSSEEDYYRLYIWREERYIWY